MSFQGISFQISLGHKDVIIVFGKGINLVKNSLRKKFKEKQFTLEAKIKLLDQELKECKEKITGTEDYFHMSTLRVELKSLRKAKKLLNNDTKKAKTKSKTKKKAKNIKEKELHQQIKDLEHQLKAFNERDEILALNETKKFWAFEIYGK